MIRHVALVGLVGCTGMTLGENGPGNDTWTDPPPTMPGEHHVGAIGVERDEDQLWVVHEENREGTVRGHLAAIDPVTGKSTEVLDVSGTEDRRVVFPNKDRMILMAQSNNTEHLVLFDTTANRALRETTKSTWYWGTRTAPSGRALVVADNADPKAPLHVIDTATLGHRVLPHGGDLIEAMWNHNSDVLLALSVTDPFDQDGRPSAKLLRFDYTGVDPDGPPPTPTVQWQLDGYGWDFWFSFTWITISPDDHWAVFPMIRYSPSAEPAHVLLVLDQTTGGVSIVDGSGPVGFTRDSRFIVSYGPATAEQELWLIDPVTHERISQPFGYAINFFPLHDADSIVVTSSLGTSFYDVPDNRIRSLETVIGMTDFVTRPGHAEMFAESASIVFDLSIADATATPLELPGLIANINVRPTADQAVAADANVASVYRFDMETHEVAAPIALPSPFTGTVPALSNMRMAPRPTHAPAGRLTSRREHAGDAVTLDR